MATRLPYHDPKRLLDIDLLRASGSVPHWFGLGFIQLKLDDQHRMHFWHPELAADVPEEEIHDHRYDFESVILHGELTHETFDFKPNRWAPMQMAEVSCDPENPAPDVPPVQGEVIPTGTYRFQAGSRYTFRMGAFHRAKALQAITFLTRGPVQKRFARVIRPAGSTPVCPFGNPMPAERLWEAIADLVGRPAADRIPARYAPNVVDASKDGQFRIPDGAWSVRGLAPPACPPAAAVAKGPGYHLREIAKGAVGEPSKIFEEVEEFADALEQGVELMALIELSDLVGAVEAYLAKHHTSLKLEDLRAMSDVTKRAFVNGRRG